MADFLMDYFGFDPDFIPEVSPTFSLQGYVTKAAAVASGLPAGIPVAYRAGDQPNNALSLNVLNPGEIAATGGTSGVVYGVLDRPAYDPQSRVNGFAHVNHHKAQPRIGILLCINGSGILYAWVRQNLAEKGVSYNDMERLAAAIPIGSDGLRILPFGNGAERMLGNRNPGAQVNNLHFNRHGQAHVYRAALEGIAFSFVHGVQILKDMGLDVSVMRVGNDNLFQSTVFAHTVATLLGCSIEVVETTGAVGAAKASGVATGIYPSLHDAMKGAKALTTYMPQGDREAYQAAYAAWGGDLGRLV